MSEIETHPVFAALSPEARQTIARNAQLADQIALDRKLRALDIMVHRFTGPHYGYPFSEAATLALRAVVDADESRLAVMLGEIPGCSNCGRGVVHRDRCEDCLTLPSDEL